MPVFTATRLVSYTASGIGSGKTMPVFEKLPGETDLYTISWSARLAGETISATKWGWHVQTGLSALASSTASGSMASTVTLSAGSAGSAYWVSGWVMTTASGRVLFEYFQVRVGGVTG